MTPEQEIASDLLEGARRLIASSRETLAIIGTLPTDQSSFETMTGIERIAVTAMLKQFEQLEGAVHGLFRAILRLLAVRLKGLFPLDVANRMQELGIIDDPHRWVAIVKLRNALAHEYPVGPVERLDRVLAANAAFPFLFDATAGAERIIRERRLLDEQA